MRFALLIAATVALSGLVAGCSMRDCAYYGGADANARCVIVGPSPVGGGF